MLAAGSRSAHTRFSALVDGEDEDPETATVSAALGSVSAGAATIAVRDPASDAPLGSLTLTEVDIGSFDAETTAYAAEVA